MLSTQLFIYIYSLIIQVFIIIYVTTTVRDKKETTWIFISMVSCISLLSILEAGTWHFIGKEGAFFRQMNIITNTAIFCLNLLPMVLGLTYFDLNILGSEEQIQKRRYFYATVWVSIVVINLATVNSGFMFHIDEYNIYHRGIGMYINIAAQLGLFGFYIFRSMANLRSASGKLVSMFVAFSLAPTLGGLIQSLFYGLPAIWPMFGLLTLFMFIFLVREEMRHDTLTGLRSRGQFEERLQLKLKRSSPFTLIMIDLDKFKNINDTYGHNEGDQLLIEFSNIIESSIRRSDLSARIGGDEFVILIESTVETTGVYALKRLQENVDAYNRNSNKPYDILYSLGYTYVIHPKEHSTLELLGDIDERMYHDKSTKRQKILK